jgi:hypothetical protein
MGTLNWIELNPNFGETIKTDSEVSISILKCLKLNALNIPCVFHQENSAEKVAKVQILYQHHCDQNKV